ncbi:MAG: hypothetical protein Q4G34_11780, partial [Micrococcus sp.]|nr:hypothetical protein [Micrococcus sp.]
MDDRVEALHAVLATCRPAWIAGHGDQAWAALEQAEHLAGQDDAARVQTWSMRAGLHLLAEQFDEGVRCAERAVELGRALAASGQPPLDPSTREAVLDARVTLASMADEGPYPATGTSLADACAELDEVSRDPALAGTNVASRAVNNALNLRLTALWEHLHTVEGQVEAWVQISAARTLVRGWPDQGNILRQAVDVGMHCGQWERAWSSAQEQIADTTQRNELIAVLAKAALLAWHADRSAEARELGERARALSVAVDLPWVRTYAYLGYVVAAAAGAGSLAAGLEAYARCTDRTGHASRPHRAWRAAQVALDCGHPADEVEAFLVSTLPDGLEGHGVADQTAVLLADARHLEVDPGQAERLV